MRTLITLLLCLILSRAVYAIDYYVDPDYGDDSRTGRSPQRAWKSLDAVNAMEFKPGDAILLKSGSLFRGTLSPKGSGSEHHPITLSSYGKGPKPLILGGGSVGSGTVNLCNQSFWVIENLEITNAATSPADRRGVEVKGENGGLLRGIHLRNLTIHDISGIAGNGFNAKRTAGIYVRVTDDSRIPTRFDDLRIEGCVIYNCTNQGIALDNERFNTKGYPGDSTWNDRKFTGVVIRDNVLYNITKNAMIVRMTDGGVVEHNVCFQTATGGTGNSIFSRNVLGTVFRYNEGFLNKSHDHDGSLYDPDLCSPKTTWLDSYSHDNAHGLLWLCTDKKDVDITVRGNLSQNDQGYLVYYNYPLVNADVQDNIFYIHYGAPYLINENNRHIHQRISFTNNLVVNESDHAAYEYLYPTPGVNSGNRHFAGNQFMGKPLAGEYARGEADFSVFRTFHRNFIYTDAVDSLLGNPFEKFVPRRDPADVVVARVNGIPVFRSEIERLKGALRADYAGQPEEKLDSALFETIKRTKVTQELMLRKGLYEAVAMEDMEGLRQKENAFRKANDSKNGMLFFGPVRFDDWGFYNYFRANAVQRLKYAMTGEELRFTEDDLRAHFETGDKDRFDPAWHKRGYDYSIRAIRNSLIDKLYEKYIDVLAADAEFTKL